MRDQQTTKPSTPDSGKAKDAKASSLAGTFVSVLLLGVFLVLVWLGIFILFISRG